MRLFALWTLVFLSVNAFGSAAWRSKWSSPHKAGAKSAGGPDLAVHQRELNAVNMDLAKYDQKTYRITDNVTADQEAVAKLKARQARLQALSKDEVAKITSDMTQSDKELITLITTEFKAGDKALTEGKAKDIAETTLARIQLSDLRDSWQSFLDDAKDTGAQLRILEMKLDQSVMGAYVKTKLAGFANTSEFCSAVKNFSQPGSSCPATSVGDTAGGDKVKNEGLKAFIGGKAPKAHTETAPAQPTGN